MQPDLPWNVAGIPPEAREAARAAARREGLPVGEWLTRRILRGLMEGSAGAEHAREAPQAGNVPEAHTMNRPSEDMLARVSRSETESQTATKRIEEQLRAVARRLDQAERNQSESSRAMSKAAAEINAAAREQAQAFDQLGAHVVGLNERISRIERHSSGDGLKDAVKALHQGLSRLADQMSETASQSASQIAVLAGNVEQVSAKLIEARGVVDHLSESLHDRMATLEGRVRNTEQDTQSHASAVAKALTSVEAAKDVRKAPEARLQRQAARLAQVNTRLDELTARFADSDERHSGTLARLEEIVAKLEAVDGSSERRLQNIEQALTDIVARLEKTEHHMPGAAGTDDPTPQPAPKPPAPSSPAEEALAPPATASDVDLPPFAEQAGLAQQSVSTCDPAVMSPEPPPFAIDANSSGHAIGAHAFAAQAVQQAGAAGAESFLAAARRSARTTAEAGGEQSAGALGRFNLGATRNTETESKGIFARYGLAAVLGILIVAAVAAGALLSRNLSSPSAPTTLRLKPVAALPLKSATTPELAQRQTTGRSHATAAPSSSPALPPLALKKALPGATSTPSSAVVRAPRAATAGATRPVQPGAPSQRTITAASSATAQPKVPSPLERLTSLANSGNANAELLLGLKYLDGDGLAVNEAEAAKWLERAAKQNVPVAAYRLGTLYERGHGVPVDAARAVRWYGTAAKLGNRKAMHNLAVAYADGRGVQKDLVVAAQWFSRAANLGLADSQFNLAVLYERGMGVQQSLIDAYKWYAVAAGQGDAESRARIETLSTQLSAEDRMAAQKAAETFHPDAAGRTANAPPDVSMVLGG